MTDDEGGAATAKGRQNPTSVEDRHLKAVKKAYREGRVRMRELREAMKKMAEERRQLETKLETMAGELGLPGRKKQERGQFKAAMGNQEGKSRDQSGPGGKVGPSGDE